MKPRDRKLLVTLREAQRSDNRKGVLSQRELAAVINISPGHYADIERGARNPSYDVAERIATFYGLTVAALFEEEVVDFGAEPEAVPS